MATLDRHKRPLELQNSFKIRHAHSLWTLRPLTRGNRKKRGREAIEEYHETITCTTVFFLDSFWTESLVD